MSKFSTTVGVEAIKWKDIYVDPEKNARKDMSTVPELAASMKDIGQTTPVLVQKSAGNPEKKPYELNAGFRRMAAFKLNGWTAREIYATIREYSATDRLGRLVDHWSENNEREGLSAAEQMEFITSLVEGTYAVSEGETAEPISKDDIIARFHITRDSLNKMLKAFKVLREDVALLETAKTEKVPMRELVAASTIGKQVVTRYVEKKKDLQAAGRQRAERQDAGTTKKSKSSQEEAPAPHVEATKKVGKEIAGKTRRYEDYIEVLRLRRKGSNKADGLVLDGMIAAFRFVTGEMTRLPILSSADFKAYDVKADEASAEAAE